MRMPNEPVVAGSIPLAATTSGGPPPCLLEDSRIRGFGDFRPLGGIRAALFQPLQNLTAKHNCQI
jgi:hypothetical protein